MRRVILLVALACLAAGVSAVAFGGEGETKSAGEGAKASQPVLAKAIFAGGCFWCVESDFDRVEGVVSTTSGYTGGTKVDPTYEEVSSGSTGHAESVLVEYDPAKVRYSKLLDVYWHSVDPTTKNAQFCDHGSQYRTAIFATSAEQLELARQSKAALERTKPFREPIVTEIALATTFYPAEDYHQDYYLKNPLRYQFYRSRCGRDARLRQVWGDQAIQH